MDCAFPDQPSAHPSQFLVFELLFNFLEEFELVTSRRGNGGAERSPAKPYVLPQRERRPSSAEACSHRPARGNRAGCAAAVGTTYGREHAATRSHQRNRMPPLRRAFSDTTPSGELAQCARATLGTASGAASWRGRSFSIRVGDSTLTLARPQSRPSSTEEQRDLYCRPNS